MRACPYCGRSAARPIGMRGSARFVRCSDCRSVYMDVSAEDYARVHDGAFEDDAYFSRIGAEKGLVPDRATWRQFQHLFPPGPLLEIGPGTGHLLAAAKESGRRVLGVESSAAHRRYVRTTWAIDEIYESLEHLPARVPPLAAIVAINVIEHVLDVVGLFERLTRRLGRGGVIFISTPNAECALIPVVGVYWTMFKQPDHVSFPSREGLRRLGHTVGLKPERVWTGETPLETPVGIAVAVRDYLRERRSPHAVNAPPAPQGHESDAHVAGERRILRALRRAATYVDPSRWIVASLGRAAAVRALYRRA